ncbi:MAG: DUF3040 domain-containing protein [Actinomycetota bacterium]
MSADEPSLSEHEQRILAEIERNLTAEDPDFVRNVSEPRPTVHSSKLLRISILGCVIGLLLLFGYLRSELLGIAGFLIMLAGIAGIVTSIRGLPSGGGRSPSSALRDVLRRAEDKMRPRRRDQ